MGTELDARLEGMFQRSIALLIAFPEATVADAWNRAMLEDAILAGLLSKGHPIMANPNPSHPNPAPSTPHPAQPSTPQPSQPHPNPTPGGTPSR